MSVEFVWVPKVHVTYQTGHVDVAVVRYVVLNRGRKFTTVTPYGPTLSAYKSDKQRYPNDICFTGVEHAKCKAEQMAAEARIKLDGIKSKLFKLPREVDFTQ